MTGQCRRGGRAVMGEYVLLSLPHCHLTRPPQASARGPDYVASPFPSLGPSVALSSDQMLPGQGAEGLGNRFPNAWDPPEGSSADLKRCPVLGDREIMATAKLGWAGPWASSSAIPGTV